MPNELSHSSADRSAAGQVTQSEFDSITAHRFNAQATGDIPYASSATQISRLAVGSVNQLLTVTAGLPAWATTLAGAYTFSGAITFSAAGTAVTVTNTVQAGAFQIATNSATAGALRVPNAPAGGAVAARNAANTVDVPLITLNASNQVHIAYSGYDIRLSDTGAQIGFFGTAPVLRRTSGADLTNNVTAGGVNDTIANYTDLVTYSNDAAAIRNDIYQLARQLKQVNDGLRAFGLFS